MNKINKDFWKAILKKKIYIMVISVIFAITGVCYTLVNVEYTATKKVLLGTSENMNIYKELLVGSELLGKTIENTGVSLRLQELAGNIEVRNVEEMDNVLEIKISGEKAEEIQAVSNELLNVFANQVQEIYGEVVMYKIDDSGDFHSKSNSFMVGIMAGLSGFLLSSLLFAICILLDNKIQSCQQIEEITQLKTLISIPCIKPMVKKKLNLKVMKFYYSEVFKVLMTNIQFVNVNHAKSNAILITSPKAGEGKTYVAINLGMEFAKAGKKVIIIDSDMRRGKFARIFDLPNDLGFSNYLSNLNANGNTINERINSFINDTEIKNLNVITSGNFPPNPAELLKGEKIKELIKDLKVFYDVIIFDTVPILEAPEAKMLSSVCDLTLVMSAYGDTKMDEFKKAYEEMKDVDGSIIGMGLNKIPDRRLKRKFAGFEIRWKRRFQKYRVKICACFEKMQNSLALGEKFRIALEVIFDFFENVISVLRNVLVSCRNHIKLKSQDVKEHWKNYKSKREATKLIDAGEEEPKPEKNIVREVFASELAKLEMPKEESVVVSAPKQTKSKLDLMKEQQEKGTLEVIPTEEKMEEDPEKPQEVQIDDAKAKQEEMKRIHEELKEKQRIEREKKEELKRQQEEKKKSFEEMDYQIDFQKEEVITEEMIRRQVEMDDFVRMAENEQKEERLQVKREKLLKKNEKRKQRLAKKELKVQMKEEKKVAKQREKQIVQEEARIKEELQEDNLYPKIHM